jgi:hypothetical protein
MTVFGKDRGKSAFTRELEKRGIRQIVARPRRPQTLGKIERFWGSLWRECVESAAFVDLGDARQRIGHFIDHYNFQRSQRGIFRDDRETGPRISVPGASRMCYVTTSRFLKSSFTSACRSSSIELIALLPILAIRWPSSRYSSQ